MDFWLFACGDVILWLCWFQLSKKNNSYKTCFHGGHKLKGEVYPRKTKKTEPPRIIMIPLYLKLHTVYRDELKNISFDTLSYDNFNLSLQMIAEIN